MLASIPSVGVVRIDWHPAREHIVASVSGSIHPLLVAEFHGIGERLLDVCAIGSPRNEGGELDEDEESLQPGHEGGLFAGKA